MTHELQFDSFKFSISSHRISGTTFSCVFPKPSTGYTHVLGRCELNWNVGGSTQFLHLFQHKRMLSCFTRMWFMKTGCYSNKKLFILVWKLRLSLNVLMVLSKSNKFNNSTNYKASFNSRDMDAICAHIERIHLVHFRARMKECFTTLWTLSLLFSFCALEYLFLGGRGVIVNPLTAPVVLGRKNDIIKNGYISLSIFAQAVITKIGRKVILSIQTHTDTHTHTHTHTFYHLEILNNSIPTLVSV